MSIKVGINGFGRIARVCIRTMAKTYEEEIDVVAVNQRNADLERMAYMLEYDSVFGRFEGKIEVTDYGLRVNGHKIRVSSFSTLDEIDWNSSGADYIIESTGAFTNMADCRKHIDIGGAKKVVLSAPGKDKSNGARAGAFRFIETRPGTCRPVAGCRRLRDRRIEKPTLQGHGNSRLRPNREAGLVCQGRARKRMHLCAERRMVQWD